MRSYPGRCWHVFHHVFECAFADRGIAVPHFIFLWLELCWHFSWSLKQSLQVRIQVFKEAFKSFHRAALWIRTGAIIGDGDRKRALILLLGLSPWYGTIFLFLEQIAPSTVAHARTCCEDICVCREGEMTSVWYFWPTTANVCWNFTSVFSS